MCQSEKIHFYKEQLNIGDIIKNQNKADAEEALNICDLTRIEEKYREWVQLMPRVKPYYAVKCNDDPHIVRTLVNLGSNFDCASKNEIKQILEYGVSPDRIIFANPCKPLSHLRYAKEHQVKSGTVDNEFELYKIYKQYPESNVVIRFRCEAANAQCPLGEKFGCCAENDATALMLLARSLNLNVIGTSFHVGSGCSEKEAYDRAIKITKNLFKFGELLNYKMNLVDIGGGFPGNNDEKFAELAQVINTSLAKHFPNEDVNIIAEPGRYFAASAITLVCKIYAKRELRVAGKLDTIMYYLNDGVYGMFNCILYDHQHVQVRHLLPDDGNLPKFKTLLWGPTCDGLDKITNDVKLPNLSCGDFLVFDNMGAYTMPIASAFNGFSVPTTLYFKQLA